MLVGHRDNEPWFGTECPPECPGLAPGDTYEPMEEIFRPAGATGPGATVR